MVLCGFIHSAMELVPGISANRYPFHVTLIVTWPRCPWVTWPCRYKCNPGFELIGDTYLTCVHGKWKGNVPTCQEGKATSVYCFRCNDAFKGRSGGIFVISLLQISRWVGARNVGVSRNCPNFLSTPIITGRGKATNFKFCTHVLSIDRNKSPLQISGKVALGVLRDSRSFSGHPCTGRIARSSLR